MPILIFVLISFCLAPGPELLKKITEFSFITHNTCLVVMPKSAKSQPAFSALLCGENVTDETLKATLVKSSLIHLFVVSGSHLLLLDEVLLFCKVPWVIRFFLFGWYSLVCSWQAPVVRSLLGLLLKFSFRRQEKYWPTDLIVLFTGLLSLLLFSDWANSRSLLMSWYAALALAFVALLPVRHPVKKIFIQSAMVYLMMLPAIWGFGSLHPLAIVFNIFLAPLVSLLLFPLSFFACFFSFLVPWFEKCFEFFLWISGQATEVIAIEKAPPLRIEILWIILFSLHFAIHILRVQIRRRRN